MHHKATLLLVLLVNYYHIVLHALLRVAFVNPDGYTGFGTPWEIAFLANYTILTKSGNIGGYSSFFTVVPDLLLGKSMEKPIWVLVKISLW